MNYAFSSFSLLILIFLATLLGTLSSILHSPAALALENLALRHQIGVLRRSARKRPKLILLDRLLRAGLSHVWSDGRSALAIVQPETVIAWHRKGFRLFWVWKIRPILIRSRERGLLEESDTLEKLSSLVKHGRYKNSLIEDARLKLEDKP